jgi:hypothetical protein
MVTMANKKFTKPSVLTNLQETIDIKSILYNKNERKMKPQTYLILVIWLAVVVSLFAPFVNAQETLGVFKQNDNVQLLQSCSVCDYVTLDSIKYPDGTTSILNTNMTKDGSTFYDNFNLTSQLGEYIYNTHYSNWTAPVSFEITPNGEKMDISQSILFGFIFLIIVGLLTFSVYGLSNSNQAEWIIFYTCSTYLLSFCMFFVAWLFSDNYLYQTPILASVFWIIWLILAICFFPFIIGVSGYILKLQAEALMMDEYTSQGYSKEDAKSLTKARRKR